MTLLPREFDDELIEFACEYSLRARLVSGLLIPFLFIALDYFYKLNLPVGIIFWAGLFEAFVNQPYPFLRRRVSSKAVILFINILVDIIVIAVVVHYSGGITIPFTGFLFLIVIVFNGMLTGLGWALVFSTLSGLVCLILAGIEIYSGHIHITGMSMIASDMQKMILAFAYTVFFLIFAVLVHLPAERFKNEIMIRRRAKQESEELEKRYRDLFEESKDAVFISNRDGRFLDINQAGVDLFGYESQLEMLNLNIARELYTNADDREKWLRLMDAQGYVKDFEVSLRSKNGDTKTVLETSTAVRDQSGKIFAFRGIIRDITDQKKMEQHLLQAQKLDSMGYLAGGIAHDFNNILTIIQSSFAVIKSKVGNSPLGRYIEIGESGIERGTDIAQRLLKFARIEEVELRPLSFRDILDELIKVIEHTFEKNITLKTDVPEDLPWIYGDRGQLYQVLLNLCINARDAIMEAQDSQREGIISISAELFPAEKCRMLAGDIEELDYLKITVSDTGKGIEDMHRSRIFDPFFTTKPLGKGTGLGLSVVYGIVRGHGGYVDYSSLENNGTSFFVYLPAIEPQPEVERHFEPSEENLPGGTETILIVEDEYSLRELLAAELRNLGYTVYTAPDGITGAELYENMAARIELVILDLGLPKLSGKEVFQRIRAANENAFVILVTGYISRVQKEELLKSGVKQIIDKPYKLINLLRAIREQLDRRK